MNYRVLIGAAFAALSFAFAAPAANAVVQVIGETAASECYQAAIEARADNAAIGVCDRALEIDSITRRDRSATYVNRGVVRLHRREWAAAQADFDLAIRMTPNLGEAHVDRGAALIMQRDYAAAITSINRGIELGSADLHEAYFNRGLANELRGDIRAAYLDYRRAAELAPEWPRAQLELARFQVQRGAPAQ